MVKDFLVGSEVIVLNFIYMSIVLGLILNNLKIVLVDVCLDNGNFDVGKLELYIMEKIVVVMFIDYVGNFVEMDEINVIVKKYNLYVVQDMVQFIGLKYKGKYIGNYVDVGIFFFYGIKNMSIGEGGVFVINNEEIVDCVKIM